MVTMTSEEFMNLLVRMGYKKGVALKFFSSNICKLLLREMARKVGVPLDQNRITKAEGDTEGKRSVYIYIYINLYNMSLHFDPLWGGR
jgi:hypothetical protein